MESKIMFAVVIGGVAGFVLVAYKIALAVQQLQAKFAALPF